MRSRFMYLAGLLSTVAFSLSLAAQGLQLEGPTSGWVYDGASRSIRPILGMAGGAHLGLAVYSDLDYASVAPSGRLALGVQPDHSVVLIQGLTSTQPTVTLVEGAISNPVRILWSKDSSAAVLCGENQARVQRVANLQDVPAVEDPIPFPSTDGKLLAVAADPAARRIVVAIHSSQLFVTQARQRPVRGGAGIYFVSEYGDVSFLSAMQLPSAVTFTDDGRDVYAADRSSGQILAFHNVAPRSAPTIAIWAKAGVSDPIGLASSGDKLLVVSQSQRTVRTYDLRALAVFSDSQLEIDPQSLEAVPQSSFYILTRRGKLGDVLLMIDGRSGQPAFFVPAGE